MNFVKNGVAQYLIETRNLYYHVLVFKCLMETETRDFYQTVCQNFLGSRSRKQTSCEVFRLSNGR